MYVFVEMMVPIVSFDQKHPTPAIIRTETSKAVTFIHGVLHSHLSTICDKHLDYAAVLN